MIKHLTASLRGLVIFQPLRGQASPSQREPHESYSVSVAARLGDDLIQTQDILDMVDPKSTMEGRVEAVLTFIRNWGGKVFRKGLDHLGTAGMASKLPSVRTTLRPLEARIRSAFKWAKGAQLEYFGSKHQREIAKAYRECDVAKKALDAHKHTLKLWERTDREQSEGVDRPW